MPIQTYSAIEHKVLGSSTTSITFTSIPSTYTDLILVVNAKATSAAWGAFQVNGDTGSNYSQTVLTGSSGGSGSTRNSNQPYAFITYNTGPGASEFDYNAIINFMNYSNSTTFKTMISRANRASGGVDASTNTWRSTAAITSITYLANNSMVAGSTFTLYGIRAGN